MIRWKRIFQEASNNLIICDIQPEYKDSEKLLDKLMIKIKKFKNILWLYNGKDSGMSEDDSDSIKNWIIEHFDYDENIIESLDNLNIEWFDKGYAFIRDVMDTKVLDEDQIVKVIQHMVKNDVVDWRDFTENDYKKLKLDPEEIDVNDYSFYIPVDLLDFLKKYKSGVIVGGGKDECLKEVIYFAKALKLGYRVDGSLIY